MNRPRHLPTVVGGLVLLTFASLAPARSVGFQQDAPQANNPVTITETTSPASDQPAISAPDAPGSERTPRRLGRPTSLFSLGPDESDSDPQSATSAAGSLLERFDPRSNELSRVVAATAVVIGLMLLLRVTLGRAAGRIGGGRRPSGVLEVLARYPLAKGQHLVLLKLGRRVILTHQSSTGMATISEITDTNEVAALLGRVEAGSTSGKTGRFRRTLRQFESQHEPEKGGRSDTLSLASSPETEVIDLTRRSRRSTLPFPRSARSAAS